MTIEEIVEILEQEYEDKVKAEQPKDQPKLRAYADSLMDAYNQDFEELCAEIDSEFHYDLHKYYERMREI